MTLTQASAAIGLNGTASATTPLAVGSVTIGQNVTPISMSGTDVVYAMEVEMVAGDSITLTPTTGETTGTPTSFAKTINIGGTLTVDGVFPLTAQPMTIGAVVDSKPSYSSFVAAGTAYNSCVWSTSLDVWRLRFFDAAGVLIAEFRATDDTLTPVGATFTAWSEDITVTGTLTSDGSTPVVFPTLYKAPDSNGKEAFSEDGGDILDSPEWAIFWDGGTKWKAQNGTTDAVWENSSTSATVPLTGWVAVSPATGTPTLTRTAPTGTPTLTAATLSIGLIGGAGLDFEGKEIPTCTPTGLYIDHVSGTGTVSADSTVETYLITPMGFVTKAAKPNADGTANAISSADIEFTTTDYARFRVVITGSTTI